MQTECKLPAGLNPKIRCSKEVMDKEVSCPSCQCTFKVSDGVTYEGMWTGYNEDDDETFEYGMLLFCSLACALDALDVEGNA